MSHLFKRLTLSVAAHFVNSLPPAFARRQKTAADDAATNGVRWDRRPTNRTMTIETEKWH